MNSWFASSVVFACTFGGALGGMTLRTMMPEDHLSEKSEATVKVGIALIATMTALVLGLVTASAKNSYDNVDRDIRRTAAGVMTLDRYLARFGPETAPIREGLKRGVAQRIEAMWPEDRSRPSQLDPSATAQGAEALSSAVGNLPVATDEQRRLKALIQDHVEEMLAVRWIFFTDVGTTVPTAFLVILVSWLTITFVSFGLFAPPNTAVISVLFLCAVSVAAAIFLILSLYTPFEGVIRVSAGPLKTALAHIGQ